MTHPFSHPHRYPPKNDAALGLCTYAANLTYSDLPDNVVWTLKRIVLDTLGTILAANTLADGIPELVQIARADGRNLPESTIVGFGDKAPAMMAALANGAMAHALNYDDFSEYGGHLGASTIPAALAVAQHRGGLSGKDFLVALAAGAEVLCRLGAAIAMTEDGASLTRPPRPLRIQLWGYFSAAVATGSVMNLTTRQMHTAL
ncbi:MAG: hypothetical protein GEU78_18125, partial [Actinobacteria bacterium]|nr:hypothetical protein [Actinomycetota bacterium]